ncbi:hypothetical protein [Bosea massiliensis]|uniref:Uncharacterized protein n=1 Tax=Bosea massiliensis TaxID=151419 RepID=A0ABW0P9Y5_9HYPH
MAQSRKFRFEIITQLGDDRPRLVSRHHHRRTADRRLLRLPLRPGENVSILDEGSIVRFMRCPTDSEMGDLPF